MIRCMEKKWYVLYLKPRREKKVVRELNKRNCEAYLPLYKAIRKWSDRNKRVEVPLFPNYIFVKLNFSERFSLLAIPGVVRYLTTEGKPDVVNEAEIHLIQSIIHHNPELRNESIEIGERVRVTNGPFRNTTGYLQKAKGRTRLCVRIDSINRFVLVDVSAESIEKVAN